MPAKRLAAIRIRGRVNISHNIRNTFSLLRLHKPNHLVIIDDRPSYLGMLKKVSPAFIAWGELSPETLEHLLLKWGRLPGNKRLTEDYIRENTKFKSLQKFIEAFMAFKAEFSDIPNFKPVFRLHPPRKGLGRRGKKRHVKEGGVLGYWGSDIENLISRMS
ncbi:MAG: 50S ribosomal protein L30 [Promethearchaeota archaeon]